MNNSDCCDIVAKGVDLDGATVRMSALAHPARLRILGHLSASPNCCCKDVVSATDLAQSTVSQHLKVLVDAGLVNYSADNRHSRYSLNREAVSAMRAEIDTILSGCCA